MVNVVCSWVIDDLFSFVLGSIEPGKSNSEVDNDQSYSHQQENYVLHDGKNVTAESHIATLLGTVKVSRIVMIRCLHNQSMECMMGRSDAAVMVYLLAGSSVSTKLSLIGKASHHAVMVAKFKIPNILHHT